MNKLYYVHTDVSDAYGCVCVCMLTVCGCVCVLEREREIGPNVAT